MGWQKGVKRGTSPLKGKAKGQILPIDPLQVRLILQDNVYSVSERFIIVMEALLPAMEASSNVKIQEVGRELYTYWKVAMQDVVIGVK